MSTTSATPDSRAQNSASQETHSIEAEQQLLGALLEENGRYDRVSSILKREDFFDPVHGAVFDRIGQMILEGRVANAVTMKHWAKAAIKDLGPKYLVRLQLNSIGAALVEDYAKMIVDLCAKRGVLDACRAATEAISFDKPISDVAVRLESDVVRLTERAAAKPMIRGAVSALHETLSDMDSTYHGRKDVGLSTGIPRLDELLGFMRASNMYVLGGRTSQGKTTFALNLARHALLAGKAVMLNSLEMPAKEIMQRMISMQLRAEGKVIPYLRMLMGNMTEKEYESVLLVSQKISEWPLLISERHVRSSDQIRSAVRRAARAQNGTDNPLGMVIVDYVQRVHIDGARNGYERVSRASDMCKTMAMENGVPVVALAQLSREVERRENPEPTLTDLKESGALEEDADAVIFCWQLAKHLQAKLDAISDPGSDDAINLRMQLTDAQGVFDLIVAKQRSGPPGRARTYIDAATSFVHHEHLRDEGMLI